MKFLSLFSGIEAASAAWLPLGWHCVAVAEIDRFPNAVLAHHHAGVPNLGDVTKISDDQIRALGPIDVVVFGSPCQDLSVAGKRAGLAGERSGLFYDAIRIIRASGARFALWENVVGAFSSNKGRDFAAVLAAFSGADIDVPPKGWGNEGAAVGPQGMVEWSTLDAQWFGVAQRRRRVFALADFGDWANRPAVLLEPESLRGNSAPSRKAGASVAALTACGVGTCGADDNQAQAGHLVAHTLRAEGFDASEDGTGRGVPLVPICFDETQITSADNRSNPQPGDPCHTLGRGQHASTIAFPAFMSGTQCASAENVSTTICASNPTAVAFQTRIARNGRGQPSEVAPALSVADAGETSDMRPCVIHSAEVRRLTPRECERLQGFPDDYTLIPYRNKPAADGPRYKALGNSMAVPVMAWIGKRIQAAASTALNAANDNQEITEETA